MTCRWAYLAGGSHELHHRLHRPEHPGRDRRGDHRPRAWWLTDIVGSTERIGDEFSFDVPGVHWSRMRVTELVPGELVVWRVVAGQVGFVADPDEWTGTELRFEVARTGEGTEVRFTHVGLEPEVECYEACSGAWTTEHAFCLQYRNVKPDYVKAWWNVVDWADAGARFTAATRLQVAHAG